jgi:hypothetical protein
MSIPKRSPRPLRRWLSPALVLAAGSLAFVLTPGAAGADEAGERGTLHIQVRGDDGERVDLELSHAGLAGILALADFECEGEDDPKVRALMRELDRGGEGAVERTTNEDGDRIVARRRAGMLRIESRDEDGERGEVEMPWPLAECLLLGREPEGGLARALADGELRLELVARDGDGRVSLKIGDERR